jgi:hypothetical protein
METNEVTDATEVTVAELLKSLAETADACERPSTTLFHPRYNVIADFIESHKKRFNVEKYNTLT